MPNGRLLLATPLVAALAFAASAVAQTEAEFTVPEELRQAIAAQVPQPRPARALGRTAAAIVSETPFGTVTGESRVEVEILESGLIGSSIRTSFRGGETRSAGRSVTLCGLVVLLNETTGGTDSSGATAVPIGKIFVPFGFRSSLEFGLRTRLLVFEPGPAPLCRPEPGGTFSYKVEQEIVSRTSGLFGGTNAARHTTAVSCAVAPAPADAAALAPGLAGEYLAVACDGETADGKKGRSEFAFLRDAGIYLTTGFVIDGRRTSHTYSEAAYATP